MSSFAKLIACENVDFQIYKKTNMAGKPRRTTTKTIIHMYETMVTVSSGSSRSRMGGRGSKTATKRGKQSNRMRLNDELLRIEK